MAKLRKEKYVFGVVERTIPYSFIKQDFLGLFDVLAVHAEAPGVLGIQVTAGGGDIQKHIRKMQANPNLKAWIQAGNEAVIHSWAKRGPRGKRKLWTCVEVFVTP